MIPAAHVREIAFFVFSHLRAAFSNETQAGARSIFFDAASIALIVNERT